MEKMLNTEKNTEEMVTISRDEYEAQKERIAELEQQVSVLMEAVRLSRHKRFGASSEHIDGDAMEQLSLLFNEAEFFCEDIKTAEPEAVTVAAYKRHKKHEYTLDNLPDNVPTEVVEHRLKDADLVCPACRDTMKEIGKDVVRTLEITPPKITVKEHVYYTYACMTCSKENEETPIIKTPREKYIIPGSFATPEAIAYIMTQKFVMGSPLYRQEQELNRQGISLSRQTMSNWILKAAEDYLMPVYEQLQKELLTREILHADETTLQVLREPGKAAQTDSYMWLYRTSGDTDRPVVLYEYQPNRKAENPEKFLAGFTGYLHTDGYAGYHSLPKNITVVGCFAHARRKFDEALKSLPKAKAKGSSAAQGLAYCTLLFEIGKGLADLPPQERYEQRLKQEKPVLDAFLAWANARSVAPK